MKVLRSVSCRFMIMAVVLQVAIIPLQLQAQQVFIKITKETKNIKACRKLIDSIMIAQQIPGLAITIIRNDSVLWSEGFGNADLENLVKVNPAVTRFRIGSVSKMLTADALALLYESGKLDLDAEVQSYVPDFPRKNYPITVRQVAGHIAGFHHYLNEEQFLSAKKYTSVKESLDIFKDDSLLFEPGTKYSYSTYGWNLISAIVEGASQTSFIDFMYKNVFDPMGMKHTSADKNDSIITGRTRFYALKDKKELVHAVYVDNSNKWAGGGFVSTSEDMARFAAAHYKPGFLKEKTLKLFTQSQRLFNGKETGYGIGWSTGTDNSKHHYYGHTGGSVGGITFMRVYPGKQLAIAIVTNSSDASYFNVAMKIVDLFYE